MKRSEMGILNGVRGVIFDVDGTLYDQRALRRGMAARIATSYWHRPAKGVRVIRGLQAYRQAHEGLRNQPYSFDLQLLLAAEKSGYSLSELSGIVEEWFERKPIEVLPQCVYPKLPRFLRLLSERQIACGVFSDYPAEAKLSAMGLKSFFSHVLSATEVGRLKPDPTGIRLLANQMGLAPNYMLYFGDRAIDLEAATAAGMNGFLIRGSTIYSVLLDQLHPAGS